MRRVFFHVDEFGERGMVYLPHLMCLSEPLVVWGPSARLLQNTSTFLKPKDPLWLISQPDAPVRIIGREEWLLDKGFRSRHPWPLAHWVDEFDGVVKKFATEDMDKLIPDQRVIVAEPEEGLVKAGEVLESPEGKNVARRLRQLYNQGCLPVGILEKARRARAEGSSVPRVILRDVYNYSRAMVSADAQVAAAPCEHMAVLQGIVPNSVVTGQPPRKGYASAADLREAVQVLSNVKPVMTMRELRDFLKSGLKADLHQLMYSPHSLARLDAHLVREINEATAVVPQFKRLFQPNDPITLTSTIGGFVLSCVSILTGPPGWTLISAAVEAAKSPLRNWNLIPEAVRPGHRARALFYLTFGTGRPVRRQVQELSPDLDRMSIHEAQQNHQKCRANELCEIIYESSDSRILAILVEAALRLPTSASNSSVPCVTSTSRRSNLEQCAAITITNITARSSVSFIPSVVTALGLRTGYRDSERVVFRIRSCRSGDRAASLARGSQ